jgi:hypothetical protein
VEIYLLIGFNENMILEQNENDEDLLCETDHGDLLFINDVK